MRTLIALSTILLFFNSCKKQNDIIPNEELKMDKPRSTVDGLKNYSSAACLDPEFTRPGTKCVNVPGNCKRPQDCTEIPPFPNNPSIPTLTDINQMSVQWANQMVNLNYYDQSDWQIAYDFINNLLVQFYYP